MNNQYIEAINLLNEQAKKEKDPISYQKKFIVKDHIIAVSPDGSERVDVAENGILPSGWTAEKYEEEVPDMFKER